MINALFCRVSVSLAAILLVSCGEPVIWSAQSQSPDGSWLAVGKTVEHSGFGTGGAETTVDLRHLVGDGSTERVLAFADDGAAIQLKMRWADATHLSVTYKADPSMLYYEVLKTSGVQVAVLDLESDQKIPHPLAQP